ncbi:MAG: gamma-glutamyl-gamma-aminobutyrate hydrolase family protein [Micromonosporaceae bacterium]
MRPVIGVTTYAEEARWGVWSRPAALLPRTYVDVVAAAGGIPVLLPPTPGAAEAIGAVDALVLAGGADVDPASYGAERDPRTGPTHPERDAAEVALLRAALDAGTPVLGVCRGMQLLNVALGGTLIQHLPDALGHTAHQPAPARFGRSEVKVRPASRLARIIGTALSVPCYHHQGVRRLGADLLPSAWAADETVEAIEHRNHPFVIGVQWHPEEGTDVRLFRALVEAAEKELAQR